MAPFPALIVEQLHKSFGPVAALRGVDLQVNRGEIFGFLGPNGAGKTTTIRCTLDLIHPSAGRIAVLGLDPQAQPVKVRAQTGYLPGELRLDDNLSVEGMLRFFAELRGGAVDWTHVRQMGQRLDLPLKTSIKNLSKGNKQKVGVVQALMHRPPLLLLDEPTSGLDPLMQQEVLGLIREARAAGATVFLSSHVLSEVEEVCDRVGIIRQGQVVEVAETASLINRALRQVRVRFRQPAPLDALSRLKGVRVLAWGDGMAVTLEVEGEMDLLIKALAEYPVVDFETHRPSLEEIFRSYYAARPANGGQHAGHL